MQNLQPGDIVHVEITQRQADQPLPPLVKIQRIHGGEADVRVNIFGDLKTVPVEKCVFVEHGLPVTN